MFDTRGVAAAEHVAPVEGALIDDRRERLRLVAERVVPLALAREQTLPVSAALTTLFPEGGLRRGSVVAVDGAGATALALAIAAGPSAAGSWTAVVGDPSLGLSAAAEAGVHLERLVTVDPGSEGAGDRGPASVIAALVGAIDVVIVGPRVRLRSADTRRLSARMRERGSVLIRIGAGDVDGIDVGLRIADAQWSGLGEGHGMLRARRVVVKAEGRGASARPRSAAMLLPGPQGAPVALGEQALGEP